MREFNYTVKSAVGLHPRVAGVMMHLVKDFKSDVVLTTGEQSENIRKLLGILHMNIRCGDKLNVKVSGVDEEVASQELEAFMSQYL